MPDAALDRPRPRCPRPLSPGSPRLFLALAALSAAAAACGGPLDEDEARELEAIQRQSLIVHVTAIRWGTENSNDDPLDDPGRTADIPVCFTPSAPATLRTRVRTLITENWGRYARVNFHSFRDCVADPNVDHGWVKVSVNPAVDGFGLTTPPGKPLGRASKVEFTTASPSTHTILHEFGHVLGFEHEVYESLCTARGGVVGGPRITPDDVAKSVMNITICPQPDQTQISEWDIVGVQKIYGHRAPGSLVGPNAQCVGIPGGSTFVGKQLQTTNCSSNSVWERWSWTGKRNIVADLVYPLAHTMEVKDGSSSSGKPVVVAFRSDPPVTKQKWSFDKAQIRGIGAKCVTIDPIFFDLPHATTPRMWRCAGTRDEWWKPEMISTTDHKKIAFRVHGKQDWCLTVPSGAVSGTALTLATCGSTITNTRQIFDQTMHGELKWGGLCLDSDRGDTNDGRFVQLYTCKDPQIVEKKNQHWFLRGVIKSDVGTCLATARDTDVAATDFVQAKTCGSSPLPNRLWDYYFNPGL